MSADGAEFLGFKCIKNGRLLRVESDFGLVVETDGDWLVSVKLPDTYKQQVSGLCGNFNDNPDDELSLNIEEEPREGEHPILAFANSWMVYDINYPL